MEMPPSAEQANLVGIELERLNALENRIPSSRMGTIHQRASANNAGCVTARRSDAL